MNTSFRSWPGRSRRQISTKGAIANIPPMANRVWKDCFSLFLYRNRNAIGAMRL